MCVKDNVAKTMFLQVSRSSAGETNRVHTRLGGYRIQLFVVEFILPQSANAPATLQQGVRIYTWIQ